MLSIANAVIVNIPKITNLIVLSTLIGSSFLLSNCAPVKGYQKMYLNDEDMTLTNRKIEVYESNFQSYREGAVGGTNGNAGSGCGCN